MLSRAEIAARIPHQGSMCLLDAVHAWDAATLHASATSHRDPANPLRHAGRLGLACGIEYAAQAMALHGALQADGTERPRAGFLASVRNVRFGADRLDDLAAALDVHVECLSGDGNTVLYAFRLEAAGRELLSGRATVVLDAGDHLTQENPS